MSAVQNFEIFSRDDKQIDKYLKSAAIVIAIVQFFNCIFGFWISLDPDFVPLVSSWGAFTFGVVLFYIILMITCFCALVGAIQQLYRFMFVTSVLYLLYFMFGLINIGLRSNWFCFLLLFFAAIINSIVGAHFLSIEQCLAKGHHFTCRGRCFRVEQTQRFDVMLFQGTGTLVRLFGYDSSDPENAPQQQQQQRQQSPQATPSPETTHISFTNDLHQEIAAKDAQNLPSFVKTDSTNNTNVPTTAAPPPAIHHSAPDHSQQDIDAHVTNTKDSNLLDF